jgi:hypothetical protein
MLHAGTSQRDGEGTRHSPSFLRICRMILPSSSFQYEIWITGESVEKILVNRQFNVQEGHYHAVTIRHRSTSKDCYGPSCLVHQRLADGR